MAISNEYIIKARNEIANVHSENILIEANRKIEILTKIPEYANLEIKLADTMSRAIAIIATKSPDYAEKLKEISEENLTFQREMTRLLAENGYPANYLDPIFTCEKCKDTGSVNGEWCECLKKRVHKYSADELNKRSPLKLCSFNNFDLSLYPDSPANKSPREEMKNNFRICVDFAENFKGDEKGLLMTGGTGLGKTHLSLSIAKRVIEKDFCVVYCSTPELLRTIDNEQFGRANGDTMSVVTSSDLLVLDDLGAENSTERNTSLLYEIINGRICRSLPMIINTNLSPEELCSRYNERLFSRLFSMEVLFFHGNDNRLK